MVESLHVAFAAYTVSPHRGSEPGNSWRVAAELANKGMEIHVVTSDRFGDEHPPAGELPQGLSLHIVPELPVPRTLVGHVGVYWRYRAWQKRSVGVVRQLLDGGSINIVHHFSWGQLHLGSPLNQLGVPFVFGPVGGGSIIPKPLRQYLGHRDRHLELLRNGIIWASPWNPWARETARRASAVLAANTDTQKLLQRLGTTVSALIPESPTPDEFLRPELACARSRYAKRSGRILWVGRLLPRKGVLLAVDVVRRLPSDYTLTVIGDGQEMARLRSYAEHHRLTARLHIIGALPWKDILRLMDESDVFLFTSLRDTFGAQLLEAGARGLPIVALRQHGVADFVPPEAGHLESVTTSDDLAARLADGIIRLVSNEERWVTSSASARAFAERYAVGNLADDLLEVYRTALHDRSRWT